ncbi:Gamma-tubulin complex component 5, partial [Paramuricea clavata]
EFWSDLESEDESDNENDQDLEGQDLDEDERKQLQGINRTIRHPEINGVTKEVRDILCENLVEAYWLTNESSRVAEETSEMSLASQWSQYCEETNPLGAVVATQRLHEIQIVRETIWMLSGVKKLYVYNYTSGKFTVRDGIEMTHMTKLSLQKFLTTFAETASSIVELRSFIKNVCQRYNDHERIPQTFQAFGFAILKYLQKFNEDLSAIEESIIKKEETVTLSVLQHRMSRYQKEIDAIFNVYHHGVKCIEKRENYEKVACFLNAFHHDILLADGLGTYGHWKVKVLLPLFLKTLRPYVEFLDGCLTEGKLTDDSDEFCIQRLSSNVNLGPELWTSVLKTKGETSDDNVSWPTFLQPVLNEIILAGKSIILLETLGELAKNADRLLQEESLNAMFTHSVLNLTDTQNMAELFPLCLYPHIQVKYEKSCNSLIHLLKTEYMLLDHLAALRNFFFLEAGDAMYHFYTDIFKKCNRHERWQDMSYLNSLFQESLMPGYSDMQERFTVGYSKPTKITIDSFEGLELNYKAPWPINLVIDSASQKQYNDVFLFLLHLKRAKWSLDDLRFKDLQSRHIIPDSDQDEEENNVVQMNIKLEHRIQHQLHLVRFDLMQFVNGLHQYIMTRILHSKLEFEEALNKATDLDEIIKAHSLYIEKVLERCLMTNKVEVMKVGILKVLRLAVKFSKLWSLDLRDNRESLVMSIAEDLQKWRTFIVTFLTKKIKRGSYPQLEALAYSLGSKRQSSGHES